jgi:hypothetical protein
VFLLNVAVGALALLVVSVVLKAAPRAGGRARIDWLGAGVLAVVVVPLLVVAEEGRGWVWDSPASLGCFVIGVAGPAGFVLVERRMGVTPCCHCGSSATRRSGSPPLRASSSVSGCSGRSR